MDTSKAFDPYDIIGVITPGFVVAFLLMVEWPELKALVGKDGLTLADLGILVLAAFVLGHLVQGLGNLLEMIVWAPAGMPTAWVRKAGQSLVTLAQRNALAAKVSEMEGGPMDLATFTRKDWRVITMRMYGRVRTAGRSARVDGCNRTYGMFRGLSAAFLAAVVWYAVKDISNLVPVLLTGGMTVAALFRMYRVSIQYGRNLILEYIDLPPIQNAALSGPTVAQPTPINSPSPG